MAEIVLSLRDRELSRTQLTHTRFTMGRDASCDVVIDNAGVSRNHAIIVYLDNEFRVRDNDSQNGITVNGKPVKDCVIEYGDVIGIGKFELRLIETPDDFERELEAGSAKKEVAAPRNVMGTMQMNASAVAGLRDQIAAQKAAVKRSEHANGAGPKPRAAKPTPAAERAPGQKPAARAPKKERAPTPPAAAARPVAASAAPMPPTNAMLKPIAIGVAVAVVAAVAFMIFH